MKDDDNFISRWSRRKAASKAGTAGPTADVVPAQAGTHVPHPKDQQAVEGQVPTPLPPVDSLTFDSDFTPFMRTGVDPDVKRAALRTLIRDPRFNVMDGLDVYIDDYSKPDPIPPEWLEKLNQLKNLGHPVDEPAAEGEEKQDSGAPEAAEIEAKAAPAEISDHDISAAPQQVPQGPKTTDRGQ